MICEAMELMIESTAYRLTTTSGDDTWQSLPEVC